MSLLVGKFVQSRGEGLLDMLDGDLLSVGIGPRGASLGDEQRALTVLRAPGAIERAGSLVAPELVEYLQHLPGGVVRQQGLGDQAGGRGEEVERVGDR